MSPTDTTPPQPAVFEPRVSPAGEVVLDACPFERDGAAVALAPRAAAAGVDHAAVVADIVTRSKSSFTWGMRSLPRDGREAIFAIYAFCRVVDDIVDSQTMPLAQQQDLLCAWSEEIRQTYAGAPQSSIGHALAPAIARFDLPEDEFHLMIEGMRMDVEGPVVAPSFDGLLRYTRCVAGSVGRLSIRVFGAEDCPERDAFALALADALQLTNILRDVEEDAGIGRVYLPRNLLAAHGLPIEDNTALLKTLAASPAALPALCADLGRTARASFQEARAALPALTPASVRPALMMMGVYEGYLDRMEAQGFARTPRALTMPRWQKLLRSLRYAYAPPRRPAGTVG